MIISGAISAAMLHTGNEQRESNGHSRISSSAVMSGPKGKLVSEVESIQSEIKAIDTLISRIPASENLASDVALSAQIEKKKGISHYEQELLALALARVEKRGNYINLGFLLLFFCLYSACLLIQHSGTNSYDMQTSVIMSNIMSSLPQNGFGSSFFNGGAPGSTGLLSTNEDFYEWLGGTIVDTMFQDSVCGDGICESPEEVKAVGRFGCAADCGKVAEDTLVSVRVDLKTVMQRRFMNQIDLEGFNPGFKYNIFSKKFNDYVFENPMDPSGLKVETFEALRTDSFELRLFQTNSLTGAVNLKDIQLFYHFSEESIPERTTPVPWGYGDVREVLAVSQYQAQKLQEYCLNRVGDLYNARIDDIACSDAQDPYPQGFPNYFTPLGMSLQILRSYGITGDITVPSVNEYGKKILVSLVRPDGASPVGSAVKYCGPLPPNNSTVDKLPTGSDFVKLIMTTGAKCTASSRRGTVNNSSYLVDDEELTRNRRNKGPDIAENRAKHSARRIAYRTLLDTSEGPLGLSLSDVGVDDHGFWKCYSGPNDVKLNTKCWEPNAQWYFDSYNNSHTYGFDGSLFTAIDVKYDGISAFQTDSTLSRALSKWKEEGGIPPVLANASLQLRFSVVSGDTDLDSPDCSSTFQQPSDVLAFEYDFKTRLRMWNTNATKLRVWLCNIGNISSSPSYVSSMNVSDELSAHGFPPLQPGPLVTLVMSITGPMTESSRLQLHQRLCQVVWTVLDDRCKSRAWSVITSRSASPLSATRRAAGPWQVSLTWLFVSNSRATRASYLITTDINSASFKAEFPTIDFSGPMPFSRVLSPGPLPKLKTSSPYSCLSHYDCDEGLFCSTVSLTTAAQGFKGGGGPGPSGYGCDLCKYCLSDSTDPVDGWCPRDKCGPDTGSYPSCVDATKMFAANFKCKSTLPLYMERVPPIPRTSNEPEQIPLSNPNSTKRKARFLTPYNQLLGSMIITQRRKTGPCISYNDSIGQYSRLKEPKLGAVCRGNLVDNSPFGTDPAFVQSSVLFHGDLQASSFYKNTELDNASLPFGFFPHSYDQKGQTIKNLKYVMAGEAESFKVYFTERITAGTAKKFVTYLQDGGFLDQNTESVTVEIPVMNSNLNFFGLFNFKFYWEAGGKIQWDYSMKAFPIYQYDEESKLGRIFLEILLVVMLGLNCLSEFFDICVAVKKFDFMSYFRDSWNLVDLIHFSLMWTCWGLWLSQVNMGNSLVMPPGFKILASPAPETAARLLATNPDGEYAFLDFVKRLNDLGQNLALYNQLTSICVLLFVLRLLKVADFQPRIALVTRTLGNAVLDLAHFITLYCTILLGYAIAGVMLFGHQYEGYKTLSNSIFSLIIVMIAWDPSTWTQLTHSSADWAYYIFIWSWIFIAVFILLNILLAILVEGYMGVKTLADESDSPGLLTDVAGVIKHEMKSIMRLILKSFPFISDDELIERLSAKLGKSQETSLEKALKDHDAMVISGLTPIKLPSGEDLDNKMVHSILMDLFPDRLPSKNMSEDDIAQDYYLNPIVKNIMSRYGAVTVAPDFEAKKQQMIETFSELTKLDSMKRIAQMHLNLMKPHTRTHLNKPSEAIDILTLHVVIRQARNLPRMDVGSGVDVFCILFLEGADGLHRTEIRRGKSEKDWVWSPELSKDFVWRLPKDSKLMEPETNLVVLVYDKDQVTSDDLIGKVSFRMGDLVNGAVEGWQTIIRPPNAAKTQFWFWPVPIGELNLSVSLSPQNLERTKQEDLQQNRRGWEADFWDAIDSLPKPIDTVEPVAISQIPGDVFDRFGPGSRCPPTAPGQVASHMQFLNMPSPAGAIDYPV